MTENTTMLKRLIMQPLVPWQIGAFYVAAMLVYGLPLIINNYPYYDDNTRTLHAATYWGEEGRVIGDYLFHALTFSPATPNVFPLTILAGMLAMAFSMYRLATHWFATPTLLQCAILLPLWYNPFFLQMLSYQYDCFTVSVGIALVVLAVSFRHHLGLMFWGLPALMLAAGVSTHQVVLNVFIGLACLDVLQKAHKQPGSAIPWMLGIHHVKVLAGAGVVYFFTSYRAIKADRGGLIWPSPEQWAERVAYIVEKVMLFVTPANMGIFILLAAAAMGGWLCIVLAVQPASRSLTVRLAHVGLCVLCLTVLLASVGGMFFFVRYMEIMLSARVLMSLSPLLVGLLFLAYVLLIRFKALAVVVIYLPLLCFLSFAYAYGQVMHDKKELEVFVRTLMASDLLNHPALAAARDIYILEEPNGPVYTPVCVNAALPAMPYIFNNKYLLLSEQLIPWGLAAAKTMRPDEAPLLHDPVLVRPYYEIYMNQDVVYVKRPPQVTTLNCHMK